MRPVCSASAPRSSLPRAHTPTALLNRALCAPTIGSSKRRCASLWTSPASRAPYRRLGAARSGTPCRRIVRRVTEPPGTGARTRSPGSCPRGCDPPLRVKGRVRTENAQPVRSRVLQLLDGSRQRAWSFVALADRDTQHLAQLRVAGAGAEQDELLHLLRRRPIARKLRLGRDDLLGDLQVAANQ